MPSWNNIDIQLQEDSNMNIKQFEIELNRRLRYYLSNIDASQIISNLNDLNGILLLSKGGTGNNLSAPATDRILFYDVSNSETQWLDLGTGLSIVGTDLIFTASDFNLDDFSGILALTKGGTGANLTAPAGDRILFYDQSNTTSEWLELGSGLSITDTTLNATLTSNKLLVTTKTITHTLTTGETGLILYNSATDITSNLPTASGNTGLTYTLTNINTGIVTIDPFSTETIHGDTTFNLYQDENIQITSNGTNWYLS